MARVKTYDLDEIDDIERDFTPYDGPLPKPGVYNATVRKAEAKESSNGNDMIEAIAEITEKPYTGCPLWVYVVFAEGFAMQRAKETLLAFGMPRKGSPEKWAKLLVGKSARLRVKLDTYEGEKKAKVTDVLPAKKARDADPEDDAADDVTDAADDADDADDGDDDSPF